MLGYNLLHNSLWNISSSVGYFVYGGVFTHMISLLLFIYDPIKINLYIFFLVSAASIFINFAIYLTVFFFIYSQKYYASVYCLVYSQIIWSLIIGLIFFNEILNNFAFFGALIILLSGIISIPGQYKQVNE